MDFWRHKKVLITGHTGFKGSWLSLLLTQLNARVIGFSLPPPTTPSLFELAKVAHHIEHHNIGDIRDYTALYTAIKQYQPEIVIHMAAQPLVLASYHQPIETYATNVLGTVHLFEALRQVGCAKAIVNVTTDKCYENQEWEWGYRENDRLGGHDPYSNSKACAELVTAAYQRSFFVRDNIGIATARAGNVIGGGDWAENRLIPDLIQGCMENKTITLRHPNAYRPWQHVLEPLTGYLLLAEKLYQSPTSFSSGWNFGPRDEDSKPVKWIAAYITKHWGNNAGWTMDPHAILHEANQLKLDATKAKQHLGWQPRWHLAESLNQTIEWYKAYQAKQNMYDVTLKQIATYLSPLLVEAEVII